MPHPANLLSAEYLASYNDSFEVFNSNLWDHGVMTWEDEQLSGLKPARVEVQDGSLIIETKPAAFSIGAISSNFEIVGDFDLQVDCDLRLANRLANADQLLFLALHAGENVKDFFELDIASISFGEFVNKKGRQTKGMLRSNIKRKLSRGPVLREFHGSLRISREGDTVSAWYRKGDGSWKRLGRSSFVAGKVRVVMGLRNFQPWRTEIGNPPALSVRYDNFIINKAQGIEEEDI